MVATKQERVLLSLERIAQFFVLSGKIIPNACLNEVFADNGMLTIPLAED